MVTLPFAFIFVFYALYAALFGAFSLLQEAVESVRKWATVGIHPQLPSFDLFYVNTNMMSFVVMLIFSIFLLTLYIGNTLTDDRQQFYRNFPIFFLVYPLLVPVFLGRAVYDTVMHKKNEWILQDTKEIGSK